VQKNRRIYLMVGAILVVAALIHFMPPGLAFSISRFFQGDRVGWRKDSLLLPDDQSTGFVTKGNQLQVNYRADGNPSLSFDSVSNPSKLVLEFAVHFCASTSCVAHTKFDARMGAYQAKCVKFGYLDSIKNDISYVLCGIDSISIMAKYVGPATHVETATKGMESLVAQMK
jgi:hypothetical protein